MIAPGIGTGEACRQLGVARTTSYYWRTQRGGLPPATIADHARSGRYLSLLERERIAVLRQQGLGVNEIARRLARAPSTISRELRRNMLPRDRGVYHPGPVHARSREQARRTRVGVFARDEQLNQLVQKQLKVQGSPEQIAGWLHVEFLSSGQPVCRYSVRTPEACSVNACRVANNMWSNVSWMVAVSRNSTGSTDMVIDPAERRSPGSPNG